MSDETSLQAAYFCSAINAAHAAFTGLFSLRRVQALSMRFWILYYAIFGPKYTRWALLLFALGMALFFFCFVHEAFDSPRPLHALPTAYRPQPIKLGLPPAVPSKPGMR
jgi:hypothetical protein